VLAAPLLVLAALLTELVGLLTAGYSSPVPSATSGSLADDILASYRTARVIPLGWSSSVSWRVLACFINPRAKCTGPFQFPGGLGTRMCVPALVSFPELCEEDWSVWERDC